MNPYIKQFGTCRMFQIFYWPGLADCWVDCSCKISGYKGQTKLCPSYCIETFRGYETEGWQEVLFMSKMKTPEYVLKLVCIIVARE